MSSWRTANHTLFGVSGCVGPRFRLIVRRQGAGAFAAESTAPAGTWRVFGSSPVYESPWVIALADVIAPSGDRFRHLKLSMRAGAMVVVLNEGGTHVLLSWRHRFVPDLWNWELPGGLVEADEDPSYTHTSDGWDSRVRSSFADFLLTDEAIPTKNNHQESD